MMGKGSEKPKGKTGMSVAEVCLSPLSLDHCSTLLTPSTSVDDLVSSMLSPSSRSASPLRICLRNRSLSLFSQTQLTQDIWIRQTLLKI